MNAFQFQLLPAVLTALMGSLDAGSANNVYIPQGFWFILLGTLGLSQLTEELSLGSWLQVPVLGVAVSYIAFAYNPVPMVVSPSADRSYRELVSLLDSLEASVYAPSVGYMQEGFELYPTAHWVALEDMIRGPGKSTMNHPTTRQLLRPAIEPKGDAYVLANVPLRKYPWLRFLEDHYELESDLGDRFKPLQVLPKRFDHRWPRFLYRHKQESAPVMGTASK